MYQIARCNRNPFAHDGSGSPLVEHRTLTVVFWHSRSRKRYLCCHKELAMTLSAIGEQAGSRNGDERQIREKACVAPASGSSGQTILHPATLKNIFYRFYDFFSYAPLAGDHKFLCDFPLWYIWRRWRDLNPRGTFAPYSLSRGAPSPLGYISKGYELLSEVLAERMGFEPMALMSHRFSRPAP